MKVGVVGISAVPLEQGRSRSWSGSSTAGRVLGQGRAPQRAVRPPLVVIVLTIRGRLARRGQTPEHVHRRDALLEPTGENLSESNPIESRREKQRAFASREQLSHDAAVDVGQAAIDAVVPKCEPLVIDAE